MQIKKLFNLLQDVQDLLSMFEHVSGTAQMVSCLERMRRGQAPEDFLNVIQSLRVSLTEAFNDQLELGGDLGSDENEEGETANSITDSLLDTSNWEAESKDETSELPIVPNTATKP